MANDRNESFFHLANQISKEFIFHRQDIAFWREFSEAYPLLGKNAIINFVEQAQGGLVMTMRAWLLDGHKCDIRKETTDIEFPATPWEFFKQRYMPQWFTTLWPVKMQTKRVVVAEHHHYLCPHLVVDPDHMHYKWMAVMSEQMQVGAMSNMISLNEPLLIVDRQEDGKMLTMILSDGEMNHHHFGIVVADIVRHIANAFKVGEDEVWLWVDKERYHPTSPVIEIKPN